MSRKITIANTRSGESSQVVFDDFDRVKSINGVSTLKNDKPIIKKNKISTENMGPVDAVFTEILGNV